MRFPAPFFLLPSLAPHTWQFMYSNQWSDALAKRNALLFVVRRDDSFFLIIINYFASRVVVETTKTLLSSQHNVLVVDLITIK